MQTLAFHSCLSEQICRLIELRCLSGTDYQSQARLLWYFDRFLSDNKLVVPPLTREIVDSYMESLSHLHPRSQYNRFCVVSQLCKHMAQSEPCGYIPEPLHRRSLWSSTSPYIFNKSQIETLLSAASQLRPCHSIRPCTYRTLFGLLYTTGIRIGEAFALTLEDFNRMDKRLYIADGKFHKARFVPLHASTAHALAQYVDKRQHIKPRPKDAPLFINQHARKLHYSTVYSIFRKLLEQCGFPFQKYTGPRIHSFRHSFAVHRLLKWYKDGQDVNTRLPALATYMGHVNITSTQVYLRPTAELLEQVNGRFRNHFLRHVTPKGGKS